MQSVAAAYCSYKKILFQKVRLSEFGYTFLFDKDVPCGTTNEIKIVTSDHDINLAWIISRSYDYIYKDSRDRNMFCCSWDKIKLLNNSGINVVAHFSISVSSGGCSHGYFDLQPLYQWQYDLDNIDCEKHESIHITITVMSENESMSSIVEDYVKFLKREQPGDVTFVVGNEQHPAHKQILSARSEVFARMFETEMLEKKTGYVSIVDIEPDVFKLMLDFIYYGKINSQDPRKLIQLIAAANKYALKSLVKDCVFLISDKLSIDTVIDTLIVADLLNLASLKARSMSFIALNKNAVIASESYKKLKQKNLKDLSYELFEFLVEYN